MSVESAGERPTVRIEPGSQAPTIGVARPAFAEPIVLEPGVALGRYVVVAQAGEGGMGIVLRAYDPKLRREVALKRVRVADATDESGGITRLLREARAMAKLSHPNVVPVYDVEELDDGAHVVMEYVEGRTLQQWLRDRPRNWPEVLELFVQAARGLAAAHDVGLVHRDFKPANVIVGTDGRARVLDFGLARPAESQSGGPARVGSADVSADDLDERLTADDVVIGTPNYMAPEQHQGAAPDARADQYGWCVALYEALAGTRPFTGKGRALVAAKQAGPPPLPRRIPRWLGRIVARGLAVRPEHRFATMHELLDAITRALSRSRWSRAVVGGAVIASVAALGVGGRELAERRRIAACEDAGASIAELWNPEIRARTTAALAATRGSAGTADRVTPWLDEWAESWQSARTDACVLAEVQHTWDADLLARSLWCLDERRLRFAGVVDELGHGDPDVARNAVYSAAGLAEVDTCRDAELLARLPAPPDDRRAEVEALHAELVRASEIEDAGDFEQALTVVRATIVAAEGLGWPPLVATARVQEADLLDRSGDHQASAQAAEEAYFFAAQVGASSEMASAAELLAVTLGTALARPDEGLVWAQHAELALEMLGDVEGARAATHWLNVGTIHYARGAYDDARVAFERAHAMRRAIFGENHPDVAAALSNIAVLEAISGDYEASRAAFQQVLAIHETMLGPDHPDVSTSLMNLATNYYETGDLAKALPLYDRALAVAENALGPDHPNVARVLSGMASVHMVERRFAQAKELHERALAIFAKAEGSYPDEIARNLGELALVLVAMGRREEARELYTRAIATWQRSYDAEYPLIAITLVDAAELELGDREPEAAIPLLERAVAIFAKAPDMNPGMQASAEFALARALWDSGRDHRRAIALARGARKVLVTTTTHAGELPAVDAWLADKP